MNKTLYVVAVTNIKTYNDEDGEEYQKDVVERSFTSDVQLGQTVVDVIRVSANNDGDIRFESQLKQSPSFVLDGYRWDEHPKEWILRKVDITATCNWGDQYEEGAEYDLRDEIITEWLQGREAALHQLVYSVKDIRGEEADSIEIGSEVYRALNPKPGKIHAWTRTADKMDRLDCPPGVAVSDWIADNDIVE